MYLLNPNYEKEQTGVSGSIYWNRQSGNCPYETKNDFANRTKPCDFSQTGLLPEAREMVGDAKWFLGAMPGYKIAADSYSYERGIETCTTTGECTQTRKTNWTGRVGLIYPSDYGYATSGGSTMNRTSCLAKELYYWKDSDVSDCKNNDWLYAKDEYQWTISPLLMKNAVRGVGALGYIEGYYLYANEELFPVVYLKASTLYSSGDGSQENPFIFKQDSNIINEE